MRSVTILFCLFVLFACARQGTPTGGPKDILPPKFLGSSPDTLSLQVPTDLKEIKIEFDEYIILKDHTKNIVISPPLQSTPTFMPVGSPSKTLKIKFNEALQPNTTYNINFGNAIQDNNEGNKLPYFHYVFSTGDFIDSLHVSGKAFISNQKKKSEDLIVALYKKDSTYQDSLIITSKPFYVSKVDPDGNFKLDYLSPGNYQMIAFEDVAQNMQFDIGKEKFGFVNEIINPGNTQPIQLELFDQVPDYKVGKTEQKGYGNIRFKFQGQPESIEIESLDQEFTTSKYHFKPKSDSLEFWFQPAIDSISDKSKRLKFLVKNQDKIDTVSVVYSNSIQHKLSIDTKGKLEYAPGRPVQLTTNYPILNLDSSKVEVWKDSIRIPARLIPNAQNEHKITLDFPMELQSKYQISLLPDAFIDFFGKTNDSIQFEVKTRPKNDYGNLKLILENKPNHPFWLQMFNDRDQLIDEQYTTSSEFEFKFLPAAKFYFKILVDENENGHWDTGNFFERKQPEATYVFPTDINTRPMWDMVETWVIPINSTIDSKEKSPSESEEDLP